MVRRHTCIDDSIIFRKSTMNRENGEQVRIATIGGTFDTLHPGHKEYIQLAFEYADQLLIYVSSDEYCIGKKKYEVHPYEKRIQELEEFINTLNVDGHYQD